MKKSDKKKALVNDLAIHFKALNVQKLYEKPDHKSSKDWLAEVAAILKNLDEGDFRAFSGLRQHLYPSIPFKTRKHAAEQIDGFVRQKVAEYQRYDFSYLDREVKDYPEDISNYVHDKELRDRCLDLLKASSKYDRVINQATQVLEDKIRAKAELSERLQGVSLINKVLNPDFSKTILKVSGDPDEQQGFCDICRGVMLAFRNPTHHYLTDKITKEEAFKVCAFIDTLLPIIEGSSLVGLGKKTGEGKSRRKMSLAKPTSKVRIKLTDDIVSWANYGLSRYVWSSFRVRLEIDNYENNRPDYISVSMEADSSEGKWTARHFIFEGVDKQDDEFRIEANEIKKVTVFISDYIADSSTRKAMPEIDKNSLKLVVRTRSGEKFMIPLEKNQIIKG